MRRGSKVPSLLVVLTVLLQVFPAACSEGTNEADVGELAGHWRFVTTGDYENYVNGTLKVAVAENGQLTCKLIVYRGEAGSAVEKCRVTMKGKEILIDVEEVISSSVPNWEKEAFRLSRIGNEMTGQVRIVVDIPVRFTRKK